MERETRLFLPPFRSGTRVRHDAGVVAARDTGHRSVRMYVRSTRVIPSLCVSDRVKPVQSLSRRRQVVSPHDTPYTMDKNRLTGVPLGGEARGNRDE